MRLIWAYRPNIDTDLQPTLSENPMGQVKWAKTEALYGIKEDRKNEQTKVAADQLWLDP